jgi:hypothetical protein
MIQRKKQLARQNSMRSRSTASQVEEVVLHHHQHQNRNDICIKSCSIYIIIFEHCNVPVIAFSIFPQV